MSDIFMFIHPVDIAQQCRVGNISSAQRTVEYPFLTICMCCLPSNFGRQMRLSGATGSDCSKGESLCLASLVLCFNDQHSFLLPSSNSKVLGGVV